MEALDQCSLKPEVDHEKVNSTDASIPALLQETTETLVLEAETLVLEGVVESADAETSIRTLDTVSTDVEVIKESVLNDENVSQVEPSLVSDELTTSQVDVTTAHETVLSVMQIDIPLEKPVTYLVKQQAENNEVVIEETSLVCHDTDVKMEESLVVVNDKLSNNTVTFKTEILVEQGSNDGHENMKETSNNMLSEFGQSIELSEALCTSDVSEPVENNNCSNKEQVFNNEELLDILEGNDIDASDGKDEEIVSTEDVKKNETQIALQQLTRLKSVRGRHRRTTDRRNKTTPKVPKKSKEVKPLETTTGNIVNVLVKDWDDDETLEVIDNTEIEKPEIQVISESVIKPKNQDGVVVNTPITNFSTGLETDQTSKATSVTNTTALPTSTELVSDETLTELVSDQTPVNNKSEEEAQSHKRQSRVIKKKVIFDPDNPDTFTKAKNKHKETQSEKELPLPKKIKIDTISQRSQSKSPTSKLQWKKPTPKNNKQNKRLTEVDKLLMDEGAVNMIYQLTPEAPKGRKNMKTKAEFIKKIQSSTPETKEMKFRERKKEMVKPEEEARKITSGKHRTSISSSVKSPMICEDFENRADDSIIYRRHSSSSYSSSCMSPRGISDFEIASNQSTGKEQLVVDNDNYCSHTIVEIIDQTNDSIMFMSNNTDNQSIVSTTDIIDKKDCLTLKEKLNTKLSLALNKRKREVSKIDKPSKQKKPNKTSEPEESPLKNSLNKYKYLTLNLENRLAQIVIKNTGAKHQLETFKELNEVLEYINDKNDISVTLVHSDCGTLCLEPDLKPIINEDMEKRMNSAYETAETIRSLLSRVEQHNKLLVCGVSGECTGVALALLALSDVAIASERAAIALAPAPGAGAAPLPGVAAFTAPCRRWPRTLVNELVVLEQRLSAAEALRGGLLSRTLWPQRFLEQLHDVARDLAAQPTQRVLLKKQLLRLDKRSEAAPSFHSSLEAERDLLAEYWTSVEGQELLRTSFNM